MNIRGIHEFDRRLGIKSSERRFSNLGRIIKSQFILKKGLTKSILRNIIKKINTNHTNHTFWKE